MPKIEERLLDDSQRAAGIHGAGYPVRAGKETFFMSRLTKELRNEFCAGVLNDAEVILRSMASMYTPEDYKKACDDHRRLKNAGSWLWGGICIAEALGSHSYMARLTLLLFKHHHPDMDEETVEWLLNLWSCPGCGWRGVRPGKPTGQKCHECGALCPEDGEEPEKPCCKHYLPEPYYICPCGALIESVKVDQVGPGIRELQSADPRTPLPGRDRGAGETAERGGDRPSMRSGG